MYDFFWELFPGFDRSEVEKICLESSHTIFGCFLYPLVVVFSIGMVVGVEMFENLYHIVSSSPVN